MQIVVQKFGGTSLATNELRTKAVEHILKVHNKGYHTVVVVSAMGRKGSALSTDSLIEMAQQTNRGAAPRELDLMMSCGEIVSSSIMALLLQKEGVSAQAMTGWQAGIITDGKYGDATIKRIKVEHIQKELKENKILIVAGFQGEDDNRQITTLGRGGSDITAVALGAALKAKKVEIFTDVEGLMTADPNIVPDALQINRVSYNEIFQMASEGAKVIHPRAVEIAMKFNVPLSIRSTLSKKERGTTISNEVPEFDEENIGIKNIITGISSQKDLTQFKIFTGDDDIDTKLFKLMAKASISIDLINIFPNMKVFTIKREEAEKAEEIISSLIEEYEINHNVAKITIIGVRMRGVPGVMAEIINILSEAKIPVLQTADSHLSISCLVQEENKDKAVNALHGFFIQSR